MGNVHDFNDWFCIPAFFVLFRETLEAAVLVAVLIQYLDRAGQPQLKKQVWAGAAVGGVVSLAIGVVILAIYYTQKDTMTTTTAFIVEGGMLGFASIIITYFLVTHLAPGMKSKGSWQTKWERNMDELVQANLDKRREYGFFSLSFTSVLREGFEAAIFVVGFGAAYEVTSMPVPIIAGIIAGVGFGAAMFLGTVKLDLSLFFKVSAAFLALIAAGLASHASYEFQKGEAFGTWGCDAICDKEIPAPPFGIYASYEPLTDVTEHAKIDLDVAAFSSAAGAGDFDAAWTLYADGANSAKGSGLRTVRGFSKSLAGEAAYDEYVAYWGDEMYADNYIRAVLWDKLSAGSSAKNEDRPALFDGVALSDVMAKQMFVKGAQYQNTWIYALHELYSAVSKCEVGNTGEDGAPHAWDEGWAFYAGSLAGEDGTDGGELSYVLADKRCGNFGTCVGDEPIPSWRDADDGANSDVNAKLLRLYRAGLLAVQDSLRCGEAEGYIAEVLKYMTVPLIQGSLRYAYRSDPNGGAESLSSDGETLAEMHAFESVYDCLGITCADVGGLEGDTVSGFVAGMEPCEDGSHRSDRGAYWDDLEVVGYVEKIAVEVDCDDDEESGWHTYRRLDTPWYDALVQQETPKIAARRLKTARAKSCDGKGQSIAWPNKEVWDITGCCNTDNGFFFLMMVLFWYRPAITNLELLIWFVYWIISGFWAYQKVKDIEDFNEGLQEEADAKAAKAVEDDGTSKEAKANDEDAA